MTKSLKKSLMIQVCMTTGHDHFHTSEEIGELMRSSKPIKIGPISNPDSKLVFGLLGNQKSMIDVKALEQVLEHIDHIQVDLVHCKIGN